MDKSDWNMMWVAVRGSLHEDCNADREGQQLACPPAYYVGADIDGFHSIFSLWQLECKVSCDVDIDQSAGSMVM